MVRAVHSSPRSLASDPTKPVGHATIDHSQTPDAPAPRPAHGALVPPFREVYDAHFDFVYRLARRAGVPEAACDDAVQEIFLVVHRKLPDFEGRSSLRTFIYAIARRVARDQREKRAHRTLGDPLGDRDVAAGTDPEAALAARQAAQVVADILGHMDDGRREVFELAELEGFTGAEIAEALAMNVNTVHSQLREARREFAAAVARLHAKEAHRRHGHG